MTITAHQLLGEKSNQIYSITPSAMVYEAIERMAEAEVGALLVMENDELMGVISERDYTRKIILEAKSSRETPVRDIMTSEVITVTCDQTIEGCMKLMSEHHIRHLPVTDNDRVIGILSVMDVVKGIISEKEYVINQLEHYIAG